MGKALGLGLGLGIGLFPPLLAFMALKGGQAVVPSNTAATAFVANDYEIAVK